MSARADAATGAEGLSALELRVVTGRPTDEELAAVAAVLTAAVAEQQARPEPLVVADGRSWQRSNGFLRRPITPGPGAWRSF